MRISRFFAVTALAAVLGFTGSATANAAPGVHPDFAGQGRAAGLTSAQINTLQREANLYLAQLGGKQVALNKIDLNGKGVVRIALPGEDQPRQLGAGVLDVNCDGQAADYRHFCAYRLPNFRGTQIDMFDCAEYVIPDHWANGSWDNNQSTGIRARMYNSAGNLIYTTPPARSRDGSGDWIPVKTVRNC